MTYQLHIQMQRLFDQNFQFRYTKQPDEDRNPVLITSTLEWKVVYVCSESR